MAHIVELRGMSDERLAELLENAREEMFNLRFQKASARLENTARLRAVRREIAQLQEVLHKRRLAAEAVARVPEVAAALDGRSWDADVHFVYEENAWDVTLRTRDGSDVARALVNLNQKRRDHREQLGENVVKSYEVIG